MLTLSTASLVVGGAIVVMGVVVYVQSILSYPTKVKAAIDLVADYPFGGGEAKEKIDHLLKRNIRGVLLACIGFVGVFTGVLMQQQPPAKPLLAERVSELNNALQESARVVDEEQAEIEARQQLVKKLLDDERTFAHLRAVNKPALDSVMMVLQGELAKAERRDRFKNYLLYPSLSAAIGFFFAWVHEKVRNRQ